MAALDMKYATRRYNKLMDSLCLEYLTIGTNFSENTEGWNIRDMVSECAYQLGMYFEGGTCQNMAYNGDEGVESRNQARAEVLRLKRFINYFGPLCKDVICTEGHCSDWDNHK